MKYTTIKIYFIHPVRPSKYFLDTGTLSLRSNGRTRYRNSYSLSNGTSSLQITSLGQMKPLTQSQLVLERHSSVRV